MTQSPGPVYAPRLRRVLAPWRVGSLGLRVHWIDARENETPPRPLLDAARDHAASVLPETVEEEGGAVGVGFVVLHRGEAGTWLLMDWWAHGDILCQRLSRSDPDATDFVSMDDRPLSACVWELEPIAEERARFVATMMNGAPDAAAYLGS
ncbi:hypothetical protein LX81_00805 [Palleronia aestuarii]|uniref:Uncharacterized protein n=1 Tax=Palleronia aestuarii TaxID=568105 RepID=A0A2W7NFA4_9RHOB|nr:hypothetical protein [Palleronia aestuarii]PZX19105.1 hypothetical protein LX81_00805 [Palleronia aestuarii]